MGPTNQEMTAIENRDCYSVPKRRGYPMPGRATWGSTRLGQEAEGARDLWAPAFIVVSAGKNG